MIISLSQESCIPEERIYIPPVKLVTQLIYLTEDMKMCFRDCTVRANAEIMEEFP